MNHLLRDRVTVKRSNPSESSSGEVTLGAWPDGWATVVSNLPAGVQPLSGSYRQKEYGRAKASTHRGYFLFNSDVQVGDRVIRDADVFEVTFIAPRCRHHIEVDLASVLAP
jgi:hypothetical protein